jgi:hypothetical protein
MMNQKDTAIKSYNLLREFLTENNCLPYHEAKFPPQSLESFGLAKKTDDELIHKVSENMTRLDELINRAKTENPYETGLSWNTVAEVSEYITNILYLLRDRQEDEYKKK